MTSTFGITPLAGPVVDTHCHMDFAFDDEHNPTSVVEALANAAAVGVSHVIQVGCDVESSRVAVEIATKFNNVWATVAIHPNDAVRDPDLLGSLQIIKELAQLDVVRGIGETGLDYYRTKREAAEKQHISFRSHIEFCKLFEKPLIIHDRDAHDDVIKTLLEVGAPNQVVFHCYSGDAEMAQVCAQHGWYMSFAGTVTFNNAQNLREALVVAPDELILVETDSPFLTPVPLRGQPNCSTFMAHTVRAMATVKQVPELEMCEKLFSNAARVFGPF
jgi:TatD DNase family protein